jgi:hypothetical protein
MNETNGSQMDETKENIMFIKEVTSYCYNYGLYIVTDGKYDLICMDISLPVPPGTKEPEKGMRIAKIYTFSPDDPDIKRIEDDDDKKYLIKKGKDPLSYCVQAKIVDKESRMVRIGNLFIETDPLPEDSENGDFVEVEVSRFDCDLYYQMLK